MYEMRRSVCVITEAEYMFQLRKKFVPLIMQYKYKPDGWLGMILGAKMYVEFSQRREYQNSLDLLIKEMQGYLAAKPALEKPGKFITFNCVDCLCLQVNITIAYLI